MRTLPVPAFQAAPDQSILCAFEAQLSPAATPSGVLPGRKELRPRVEYYYRQLKALPRRLRRALQRRYARSLSGVALLLALGQAPALAAQINVGVGGCTLFDAITAANTDTESGGCDAGDPGLDTLMLTAGSTHTLSAVDNTNNGANGLPVVTSRIVIEGNGSTITRDPVAPEFRILAVSSAGDLTLNETTVSGGVASGGGGIANSGVLTLISTTVSSNSARVGGGGIYNYYGVLTVTDSTISGNTAGSGGGVANQTNLTLTDSTVSGNTAGSGGGVYNIGRLTLTRSLISGNTGYGAEVYNYRRASPPYADNFNLFGTNGDAGVVGFAPGRPTSSRRQG